MTAPTLIGTFASTANVTSGSVTPGTTIPAGSVAIAAMAAGASVTPTCSDAQGNTWTLVGTSVIPSGSVTTTAIFVCKVITPITGAITVNRVTSGGLAVTVGTLPSTYSATFPDSDVANSTTATVTHAAPAVTVPAGGGVVITAASTNTGRTYTAAAGSTLLGQAASSGSGNPRVGGLAFIDSASAGNVQPVLTPSISNVFSAVSVVLVPLGGGNADPIANAGADQTVRATSTVTLNGTASADPDGTIASYAWTQTGGTTVALSSASVASPTFTAPTGGGTLTFSLTVTDNAGATATDTVSIKAVLIPTLAIIGDSTTERATEVTAPPTREAATRALLNGVGWADESIYWYGRGGKRIAAADNTGKTSMQNLTDAIALLGGRPDRLIVGLGTNNGGQTTAEFDAEMDTLIAAIAAAGVPEVLWVNIGVYNVANNQALLMNPRIQAKLAAAPAPTVWRYLDWNEYIHRNGVYDVNDWIAGTGDTTHMSVQGWAKRDAWIIDRLQNIPEVPTTGSGVGTTTTSGNGVGSVVRSGVGTSGTVTTSATGAGVSTRAGSGTGSTVTSGDGTGASSRAGAGSGTTTTSASGTGSSARAGSGSGSVTTTGSGVGGTVRSGSGSGTTTTEAFGAGYSPVVGGKAGSGFGTTTTSGTGVGTVTRGGSGSGSTTTSGTGSGVTPTVTMSQGSGQGAVTTSGSGVGDAPTLGMPEGSGAGTVTTIGVGAGAVSKSGGGQGQVTTSGTGVGYQPGSLAVWRRWDGQQFITGGTMRRWTGAGWDPPVEADLN